MKQIIYIVALFLSMTVFSQTADEKAISDFEITDVRVYPNPFTSKTTISFTSPSEATVLFIVQNLLGKVVVSQNNLVVKGVNKIPFYRRNLTSGIYIYTLKTKDKVVSKRFVIK